MPRVVAFVGLGCAAFGFALGCFVFYVIGYQDGSDASVCEIKCRNPSLVVQQLGDDCECCLRSQ
jgi:hypothetical protein